ncbi:GL10881 [Drosophila persimilis]|uniref:Succinate dehydrogenase assembly factor 2-A, mitochondrial n=1 Tax=Drosophila persimilis TaxID=7234 RepID=SDF2A_DROPE|nr:succinate dehydrogenase assembly factor 2-A, mitochondrial [Drosophila persimilis]XP_002138209.2 succinate dehydrogenase assembly factor 2-A, mitochondrial [Drosophila pseudoobscura]B4GDB3.1 RecName: Full=Succinate dehydrogenase assembly factor 2-A, mitochondrial; Short=SDH assembly factor 2-A; Short=SDHAF2-A; Flags: Precursor [Drosophila persimilis]EDW31589.1 GL10881 [Drosophila persimilis]
MLRQLKLTLNISRWIFMPWQRQASASSSQVPPFLAPISDDVIVDYEDPDYLPLPEYPVRPNEPLETRKQRLLYQSRKRGMLENDLLLSTFAAKYLKDFSAEQTAIYDQLINGVSNDWDIYYWATEVKPTPEEYNTEIMKLLKEHVKNAERVTRFRQPDLT